MVYRRRFFKIYSLKVCDIWQNFYFYRILNNDNFKMEVGQAKFVTHLIITVQLYYYLKTRLLKFGQIVCQFIGKSNERIFCKLNKSEILRLYSIVGVAMETTKTSNFTGQSKFFISIFFTCQVSACELQPFSCHDLANDIHSQTAKIKLCSATLTRPVSLPKPVMDTWNVLFAVVREFTNVFLTT